MKSPQSGDSRKEPGPSEKFYTSIKRISNPLTAALIFALFGSVWILATDYLAPLLFPDLPGILLFQTLKGLVFILATSVLVYFLSRRTARQVMQSNIQEYRTRTVLANLGEAVFLINPDNFQIEYCNLAVEGIFGYRQSELLDSAAGILFTSADQFDLYRDAAGKELEERGLFDIETKMKHKDGRVLETQHLVTMLPENDSGQEGIIAIVRDISDRKYLEGKREQLVSQLRSLRRIDQMIISFASLEIGQQQIVQEAMNNLDIDAALMLTLNEPENRLRATVSEGFTKFRPSTIEIRLGEGLAGGSALDRRTVNLADLHDPAVEFTRMHMASSESFHGYACSPMIGKGRVMGVLEVYRRNPKPLSQSQVEFLETLSDQAARVIDSLSTYKDLMTTTDKLRLAYDANIEGWSRALDYRDNETFDHTLRVSSITLSLSELMEVPEEQLPYIRWGALLHDIGKIGVPDRILLKPGALTEEEWVVMKRHPEIARDLLLPIQYLKPAIEIPYCHQERWDGSGYPRGLEATNIPLEARIFAVVDVWDALRSKRPYRDAWPEDRVLDYLCEVSGSLLDPELVDVFLKNVHSIPECGAENYAV